MRRYFTTSVGFCLHRVRHCHVEYLTYSVPKSQLQLNPHVTSFGSYEAVHFDALMRVDCDQVPSTDHHCSY
jgi:hypothetical protein